VPSKHFGSRRTYILRGTIGRFPNNLDMSILPTSRHNCMSTPPTAAGSAPAPKSLLARAIGVLTSPRDTFGSVAALAQVVRDAGADDRHRREIFAALPMTTEAGRQAAIDQQVTQMQSFGMTVSDQVYEALEKGAGRMPYTTGISVLVVTPIFGLIIAGNPVRDLQRRDGVAKPRSNSLRGARARRRGLGAVGGLFGDRQLFRGSMGSVANLGALLPMLPENLVRRPAARQWSTFCLIWWIGRAGHGLAVLYRRRTQPIAILAAVVLRGDRHRDRAHQEPGWGSMNRNKKI